MGCTFLLFESSFIFLCFMFRYTPLDTVRLQQQVSTSVVAIYSPLVLCFFLFCTTTVAGAAAPATAVFSPFFSNSQKTFCHLCRSEKQPLVQQKCKKGKSSVMKFAIASGRNKTQTHQLSTCIKVKLLKPCPASVGLCVCVCVYA